MDAPSPSSLKTLVVGPHDSPVVVAVLDATAARERVMAYDPLLSTAAADALVAVVLGTSSDRS